MFHSPSLAATSGTLVWPHDPQDKASTLVYLFIPLKGLFEMSGVLTFITMQMQWLRGFSIITTWAAHRHRALAQDLGTRLVRWNLDSGSGGVWIHVGFVGVHPSLRHHGWKHQHAEPEGVDGPLDTWSKWRLDLIKVQLMLDMMDRWWRSGDRKVWGFVFF